MLFLNLIARELRRNQTKTLLGIETSFNVFAIQWFSRNQTKTLLGIETMGAILSLPARELRRNQTKTLLGIETPSLSTFALIVLAAIKLKPY